MKLTKRLGPGLAEELTAELLSLGVKRKVLRSRRLRVDTTVVQADVRSPTDSGLCVHAVSRLASLAPHPGAGAACRARLRDRRRSVGKRVRAISVLRVHGRHAPVAMDRLTAEIARCAHQSVGEARAVAVRAERSRRTRARVLAASSSATSRRPSESWPRRSWGSKANAQPLRRISLVDADARPVRMGSPRRPTEFGYKASIADTAEGFAIAKVPRAGNLPDDGLLAGAIVKAKDAGIRVHSVLADRGFSTRIGDQALREHEVKRSMIPPAGAGNARRGDEKLAATLPVSQRPRGAHLTTQAQGPARQPLTQPGRRSGSAASPSLTTSSAWRSGLTGTDPRLTPSRDRRPATNPPRANIGQRFSLGSSTSGVAARRVAHLAGQLLAVEVLQQGLGELARRAELVVRLGA